MMNNDSWSSPLHGFALLDIDYLLLSIQNSDLLIILILQILSNNMHILGMGQRLQIGEFDLQMLMHYL